MVTSEFLQELRNIRRDFHWKYDGRNIRAQLKSGPRSLVFDPIGAVCYSKTGLIYDEENWFRAAEHIGLSHITAGDLTAAANKIHHHFDPSYTNNLRRRIIEGVQLQPETATATAFKFPNAVIGYLSDLGKRPVLRLERMIASVSRGRSHGSLEKIRIP